MMNPFSKHSSETACQRVVRSTDIAKFFGWRHCFIRADRSVILTGFGSDLNMTVSVPYLTAVAAAHRIASAKSGTPRSQPTYAQLHPDTCCGQRGCVELRWDS